MKYKFLIGAIIHLFLITCTFSFNKLSGQDPFVKFYPFGESSYVNDAVILSQDRLILVGEEYSLESRFSKPKILTLNKNGDIISSKSLNVNFSQSAQSVVKVTDELFSTVLSAGRFDSLTSWKTFWMSTISGQVAGYSRSGNFTSLTIDASVALPNGDIVSVGGYVLPNAVSLQAFLVRESPNGTIVFQRLLNLSPDRIVSFHDIKLMNDGTLMVIGTILSGGRGIIVSNFSQNGGLNWSKKYELSDGPGSSYIAVLTPLLDNGFSFSIPLTESGNFDDGVRSLIVWCDSEGAVQHAKSYGSMLGTSSFDLLLKPNGNLFSIGGVNVPGGDFIRGLVLELDYEGKIVDQLILSTQSGSTFFRKLLPWHNGQGYYLIGSGMECPQDNPQMMIVSVDKDMSPPKGICLDYHDFNLVVKDIEITETEEELSTIPLTLSAQSTPDFEETSVFPSELVCISLSVNNNQKIDTLCYTDEIILNPLITVTNDRDTPIDSIIISTNSIDPSDYLLLSTNHNINGQRSQEVTVLSHSSLNSQELPEIIRGLQFGNSSNTPLTGLRTVTISVYYDCGKIEASNFSIFVYGILDLSQEFSNDTIICPNEDLLLNALTDGAITYDWSNGSTDAAIRITEPGTYSVSVSTFCQVDTFEFNVLEGLVPDLSNRDELLFTCIGDSVLFIPSVPLEIGLVWVDSFPTLNRYFKEKGIYQLSQTTECAEGVINVNVIVNDCCDIYLPNAFSPNGDGVNDQFKVFSSLNDCVLATNFRLQVYDRWGGLVYVGDGKQEGWNGTVASEPADNGVYVFILEYFNGNNNIILSGNISLIR